MPPINKFTRNPRISAVCGRLQSNGCFLRDALQIAPIPRGLGARRGNQADTLEFTRRRSKSRVLIEQRDHSLLATSSA